MDKNKIIEMYKNNICIEDILQELKITEHEVRTVLKEQWVDRKYSRFSKELDKRIAKLYILGKTQKEICYTLLVSEPGIARALKREGVKNELQVNVIENIIGILIISIKLILLIKLIYLD